MAYCDKHKLEYEEREEKSPLTGRMMTFGTCPECDREYDEEIKRQEEEMQERARENARLRHFESCNIEPMYHDSTLDNFIAESDEQKKALEYARNMVKEKAGKLVLLGANGTGKTHLAVGVVRELSGRLHSMYEITTRIRASYVPGAKETELDIVDELSRVPMLAIDEIGRTKGSEAETNWLSYIVDKRNSRGLPLILISNKHDRKTCPENGCKNCLENYISEDIMSRLSSDGHLVRLLGKDYRKIARQKNYNGI